MELTTATEAHSSSSFGRCFNSAHRGKPGGTPWVRYDHAASLLLSDAPVTVVGATGTLQGDGFRYHVDERRFELLGNVTVVQEP